MFTGIIENTAIFLSSRESLYKFAISHDVLKSLFIGSSIAFSGACLTVKRIYLGKDLSNSVRNIIENIESYIEILDNLEEHQYNPKNLYVIALDISPETLELTTLDSLKPLDILNIELPITMSQLLGGHLVSGHVDTTGKVEKIENNSESYDVIISFSSKFSNLIIPKGSITIDGVSLTINDIMDEQTQTSIRLTIIPHTWDNTIFSYYEIGTQVNIEFDIVGKYILRNNSLITPRT